MSQYEPRMGFTFFSGYLKQAHILLSVCVLKFTFIYDKDPMWPIKPKYLLSDPLQKMFSYPSSRSASPTSSPSITSL